MGNLTLDTWGLSVGEGDLVFVIRHSKGSWLGPLRGGGSATLPFIFLAARARFFVSVSRGDGGTIHGTCEGQDTCKGHTPGFM